MSFTQGETIHSLSRRGQLHYLVVVCRRAGIDGGGSGFIRLGIIDEPKLICLIVLACRYRCRKQSASGVVSPWLSAGFSGTHVDMSVAGTFDNVRQLHAATYRRPVLKVLPQTW